MRLLPRGVRKQDYARRNYFDVWLPNLCPPSRELLSQWKSGKISVAAFFARYRSEMKRTEPRQLIKLLASLARRTPIAVGCYCEDESCCHRLVLKKLIREAGRS